MALYFYFNETTGDLVYSDQDTYDVVGYTSLGQQENTNPTQLNDWVFDPIRASIKTVTKDPNLSGLIDVLTSMNRMFFLCTEITSLDISGFDTSNVTDMMGAFSACTSLISLDLDGFDTSNATDMGGMFNSCSAITSLDLSGFDTSKVTSMGSMFYLCTALTSLDLGGFDTSNVTDMSNMFDGCEALTSLDLSGFDTSKVTSMDSMFNECSALRIIDISPNMSNALSQLPAATYYDAVTRQSYAKASIPGGSTYVRDLADLDLVATMVQTRMGVNVAKRLANKALKKADSIDVGVSNVDVVKTDQHQTSYDRDTLEIVVDSTGKVTEMYFVSA